MQTCTHCQISKEDLEFPVRNDRSGRLRPYCKSCSNNIQRSRYEVYKKRNPFLHKCNRAKSRASQLKLPFNLTPDYLESLWTGTCPITGEAISFVERDRSDEFAAELDRFVPALGYVQGNVSFISRKMNRLKNSATTEQLQKLLDWMYDRIQKK